MDLDSMLQASQILAAQLVRYFQDEMMAIEVCPKESFKQACWGIANGYPINQCVASVIEAGHRQLQFFEGEGLGAIGDYVEELTVQQLRKYHEETLAEMNTMIRRAYQIGLQNARTAGHCVKITYKTKEQPSENPEKTNEG